MIWKSMHCIIGLSLNTPAAICYQMCIKLACVRLAYKRTFVHWIHRQERHKGWHESNLLMAAQATRAEAVEDSYLQVGARIRFAL